VIFAYSYIYNHPEHTWTIGYLTYTESDPRGHEISQFWQCRGIDTVFLGHVDDYRDLEIQQCSFDTALARQQIHTLIEKFDIVLTHDERGDYGHLHHKFVHDAVALHPGVIKFAALNMGTTELSVPAGAYTLDELPLHADVIGNFFPNGQHQNNYTEVTL
jgi:hypothetical protein